MANAKTILIAEDDEELNDILQYNLMRAGYRVVQTWDGRQAIEAARLKAPDLLLLDVMMPEVDGWEVCTFFESTPELKDIPKIVFTAKSAREDYQHAHQFSLAGFFIKPYATSDVLRHVERVLSVQRPSQ